MLLVQDHGERQRVRRDLAERYGRLALLVGQDRVADVVVFDECLGRVGRGLFGVDTDERDALSLVGAIDLVELRCLDGARSAPGGPEVDDGDLAARLGQRELAAIEQVAGELAPSRRRSP